MVSIVEVRRFDNVLAAQQAVEDLTDEGIDADILDQYTGTALSYIPGIGVRVVVREADAERANEVLRAAAQARAGPKVEAADGGEEEADGSEDEPEVEAEPDALGDAETWAWRTRALAFLGVAVPLLIFFVGAVWRITRVPPGVAASPRAQRMVRQARVLVWIGAVVYVTLAILFLA
jgi:hypothetical protein